MKTLIAAALLAACAAPAMAQQPAPLTFQEYISPSCIITIQTAVDQAVSSGNVPNKAAAQAQIQGLGNEFAAKYTAAQLQEVLNTPPKTQADQAPWCIAQAVMGMKQAKGG